MKKVILSVLFAVVLPQFLAFAQKETSPQMHSDAVLMPYRKTVVERMQYDAYAQANAATGNVSLVFMGDSITDLWYEAHPDFFDGNGYIGRGIGGQTTIGVLARFRRDVVNLHPKAVVILCGINDIAQNDGIMKYEDAVDNIADMCDIARANGIVPIVCSLTPCSAFFWNKDAVPAPEVVKMNDMLKAYASMSGVRYIDYYNEMVDVETGGMKEGLSADGCHPTAKGYEIMERVLSENIPEYL